MTPNKFVASVPKKDEDNHENYFSSINRTSNEGIFQKPLLFGFFIIFAIFGRTTSSTIKYFPEEFAHLPNETVDGFDVEFKGCNEQACKIMCTEADNLYASLSDKIGKTSCNSSRVLHIRNQTFPSNIFGNEWFDVGHTINEVIISSSRVMTIANGAFNSSLFVGTIHLTWYQLEVQKVENGALLGLSSLKYLRIESKIIQIDNAFLRPVHVTLTHLRLNAQLYLPSNGSLFANTYLQNLVYLDLSENYVSGPLRREMFTSMPHLRYLVIMNSRISSVEEDAFSDLAGNLEVINLSRNHLITFNPTSIIPLLEAERPLQLIDLTLNKWLCDCKIQHMARVFLEYRPRFADNIYCYAPSYLYGTPLNQLDFTEMGCYSGAEDVSLINSVNTQDFDNYNNLTLPASFGLPIEYVTEINGELWPREDQFASPSHTLQIKLFDNRSAQLIITDFRPSSAVGIVWFIDPIKPKSLNSNPFDYSEADFDYNCISYSGEFVIKNLMPNATYTFCLLPLHQTSITPYNCLPLYIPPSDVHIWISAEEKNFIIGIVSLIFTTTTVLGALVGYFAMKRRPYLLDDPKNCIIVKKSSSSLYVSVTKENLRDAELPTTSKGESVQERICATESSISISKVPTGYEIPKLYEKHHDCAIMCLKNRYAPAWRRPSSPPPLPKSTRSQ